MEQNIICKLEVGKWKMHKNQADGKVWKPWVCIVLFLLQKNNEAF